MGKITVSSDLDCPDGVRVTGQLGNGHLSDFKTVTEDSKR